MKVAQQSAGLPPTFISVLALPNARYAGSGSCKCTCVAQLSVGALRTPCRGTASSNSNSNDNSVNPGPPGYGQQDKDSTRIRWTDKVALQAQVGSASDTLQVILAALKNNKAWADVGLPGDTRRKDEGLEALYEFANFDVWSLRTEFFGRSLDLGQFERFKRVMVATPYDITLSGDYVILSEFKTTGDRYFCRVKYSSPKRDDAIFRIQMSRVPIANVKTWMIDSLIHDSTPDDFVR